MITEAKMNIPLDGTAVKIEHVFAAHPTLLHFDVDKLITHAAFYRWPGTQVVSCCLTLTHDHKEIGESRPRDPRAYTDAGGIERSFMNAREKVWAIHSFLERQGGLPA
jgi:hypothetical protein